MLPHFRRCLEKTSSIYFILLALVLIDRWVLLEHFTFLYVDDDQSIMWHGAREYAAGRFHEPYFFGQPYNTMLEGLFAVPLIKLGVSYPVALTCITSLFSLIPFVLISAILFRQKKEVNAFVVLSIPLLLSNEFGMITAIPRGWVVGTFLASFALLTLYSENRFRFFFFGLFSVFAMFASSNAVLVVFPVGIWLFAENYANKTFYWQTILGAIPPALVWYFANRFYVVHPEYVVHNSWPLDFSLSRLKPYEWNDFFNSVTPVFWHLGILIFPLLLTIGIILFRQKEKKAAIGVFAGTVFLLFTLTINKTHDGLPTVFYSWGRMFMPIPVLLAVFLARIHFPKTSFTFSAFLLLIPVAFFSFKCATIAQDVHYEVFERKEHNMYVSSISQLQTLCDTIHAVSKKQGVDIIVVGNHPTKHLINYACPCLYEDFPQTIEPNRDRRTWVVKEQKSKIHKTILVTGVDENNFASQLHLNSGIVKVSSSPSLYILKNDSIRVGH